MTTRVGFFKLLKIFTVNQWFSTGILRITVMCVINKKCLFILFVFKVYIYDILLWLTKFNWLNNLKDIIITTTYT